MKFYRTLRESKPSMQSRKNADPNAKTNITRGCTGTPKGDLDKNFVGNFNIYSWVHYSNYDQQPSVSLSVLATYRSKCCQRRELCSLCHLLNYWTPIQLLNANFIYYDITKFGLKFKCGRASTTLQIFRQKPA